jgi:large subunit ribosomal protein LP1
MSSVPVDKLSPAERSQLACTYATLILHDESSDINADKIAKLVNAAGVNVEAYWPKLIAKALQGRSVSEFFGGSSAGTQAATPAPAAPVKEEKKKEEPAKDAGKKKKEEPKPVEEEDAGMGGLFD